MNIQILARIENGVKRAAELKIIKAPQGGFWRPKLTWLQEYRRYITRTPDSLILHTVDGDVIFPMNFDTGRWCLFTGEELPSRQDDPSNEETMKIMEKNSGGKKSPRPGRWPHGYIVLSNCIEVIVPKDIAARFTGEQ